MRAPTLSNKIFSDLSVCIFNGPIEYKQSNFIIKPNYKFLKLFYNNIK